MTVFSRVRCAPPYCLLTSATLMTKPFTAHRLMLTALALTPSLALGASQVCGRLGGHSVVVPQSYAFSKAEYEDDTGFVNCESAIQILQIRARRESVSRTSMSEAQVDQAEDFLITLQPKSDEPLVPVKDALATIYDPANYSDGRLPYPKVKNSNGLIYIQGAQDEVSGHRTDIYLRGNKSGYAEFMVYCEVTRGVRSSRNCMMGYTESSLGLNVIVKIDPADVGDYRAIMHTARQAIEPIFPAKNTGE